MKKLLTIFGAFILASFFLTSCGPSPCKCSEEFYYSKKYPLATDEKLISACMELYYKEKGLSNKPNYPIEDYVSAAYYFMNHSCHD